MKTELIQYSVHIIISVVHNVSDISADVINSTMGGRMATVDGARDGVK